MASTKILLETYAAADAEQRLSMFLSHRDLRRHFTQIDMAAVNPAQMEGSMRFGQLDRPSRKLGLATLCCSWLKHCRPNK